MSYQSDSNEWELWYINTCITFWEFIEWNSWNHRGYRDVTISPEIIQSDNLLAWFIRVSVFWNQELFLIKENKKLLFHDIRTIFFLHFKEGNSDGILWNLIFVRLFNSFLTEKLPEYERIFEKSGSVMWDEVKAKDWQRRANESHSVDQQMHVWRRTLLLSDDSFSLTAQLWPIPGRLNNPWNTSDIRNHELLSC